MENAPKLQSIKDFRRARIAALLDEHGKVGLSRLVDISADYLWQMGKGEGKSARGVSDANAAKIEAALGKPDGWMDGEETAPQSQSQTLLLDPDMLAETHKACRVFAERQGKVFSVETDPVRFLLVLQDRQSLSKSPTQDELIEFGSRLAAIMTPQGAEADGRGDGVPATGTDEQKVAGGGRRRKA